jgi:hypothetical protein
MDSARLVTGCGSTQEARIQNGFDEVVGIVHQSLPAPVITFAITSWCTLVSRTTPLDPI